MSAILVKQTVRVPLPFNEEEMKRNIILLLAAVLITPQAFSQKTVLGTVEYTYHLTGDGAAQMAGMMPDRMEIKYGAHGIAIEMFGGMMSGMMGKTVVNGKTGEAFIIKDAEKTAYLMSEEMIQSEAKKAEDIKIEKMDDTKEIMGYTCQKYIQTTSMQGMTTSQVLWVTSDLKAPDYEGEAFKGMAGQGNISFAVDGFPMLIEVDIPRMATRMELEVSNIKYEKIPDSTFILPEDYTVKDFSEMNRF